MLSDGGFNNRFEYERTALVCCVAGTYYGDACISYGGLN